MTMDDVTDDPSKSDFLDTTIDFDVLEHHLEFLVHRAALTVRREFVVHVEGRQIRPLTFNVLVLVGANPGISQSELIAALASDKGTMARLIRELQAMGWLESIARTRDRRRKGVYLAPAGAHVVEQLKSSAQHCMRRLDGVFSSQEHRLLQELLGRLIVAGDIPGQQMGTSSQSRQEPGLSLAVGARHVRSR
jgi:DNA-binding MarR family transcriptional regulator